MTAFLSARLWRLEQWRGSASPAGDASARNQRWARWMIGMMVLAARPQAELTPAAAPGAPPVADACSCALQCLSRLRSRHWAPRGARRGGPRRFWYLPFNALSTRTALRTETTAARQRRRPRSRALRTRPTATATAKTRTRAALSWTRTERQARTPHLP